jgi:hypothetical protein
MYSGKFNFSGRYETTLSFLISSTDFQLILIIEPSSGLLIPNKIFMVVVFQAPLGQIYPNTSHLFISKDIHFNICILQYVFFKFFISHKISLFGLFIFYILINYIIIK